MASLQGPAGFEQWSYLVIASLRKSYKLQNFSLIRYFALFLFYWSSFCLPPCPNQCMSCLVSTLLYEFWCYISSRTRVFLDPLWPLLTIFPINRLVLYSIFFLPAPSNPSFCSLMLVVSWSLLLLLSTFLFTAASVHLTVWATMRKTRENSSRGMAPIYYVPRFAFYTLYYYLELNSPMH